MFCCELLFFHSSFAIILMGKRELAALLRLSFWCLVVVVWFLLTMPRVCLQSVIVVFPDHITYYFGWPLGSLVCYNYVLLCFCHFSMWCPGSGEVLDCLFVNLILFYSLHPSQQSFSYIGMVLPGLNQYLARINVSCSRTQRSDTGEARTRGLQSRVKHPTTEPLRSLYLIVSITYFCLLTYFESNKEKRRWPRTFAPLQEIIL